VAKKVTDHDSVAGGVATRRCASRWTTVPLLLLSLFSYAIWLPPLYTIAFTDNPTDFVPIPGAAGYQISNPSALDLTAVLASLSIFKQTSMSALRAKSVHLTGYLEHLLLTYPFSAPPSRNGPTNEKPFKILTPSDPAHRGAQLSLRLQPGLLDTVMKELEDNGVVVDERRPDVVRVAPAPLYNTFTEVWEFVRIWRGACERAVKVRDGEAEKEVNGHVDGKGSLAMNGGREEKGWREIK